MDNFSSSDFLWIEFRIECKFLYFFYNEFESIDLLHEQLRHVAVEWNGYLKVLCSEVDFSLLFLSLFVTINFTIGSNQLKYLHQQNEPYFARFMAGALILSALAGTAIGCSSSPAPLVIHMYNPKTHQALTCSARDPRAGSDASMLAGAVESCAKNLEAKGFIREK